MLLYFAADYPGSMYDARILRFFSFFNKAEKDKILAQPTTSVDAFNIRPFFHNDSANPTTM